MANTEGKTALLKHMGVIRRQQVIQINDSETRGDVKLNVKHG